LMSFAARKLDETTAANPAAALPNKNLRRLIMEFLLFWATFLLTLDGKRVQRGL
jgi:hypothetical protein